MEVQFLKYVGSKDSGYVTVRQARATSVYRRFHYHKDLSLRVGVDVPQLISKYLVRSYPGLFKIVNIEIDSIESFRESFLELIKNFNLSREELLKIINLCLPEAKREILKKGKSKK